MFFASFSYSWYDPRKVFKFYAKFCKKNQKLLGLVEEDIHKQICLEITSHATLLGLCHGGHSPKDSSKFCKKAYLICLIQFSQKDI